MSTAKEKAVDLCCKYTELFAKHHIFIGLQNPRPIVAIKHAKQAAIIAVDELIEEQTMWQNGQVDPVKYWQEVKKEIEKINE